MRLLDHDVEFLKGVLIRSSLHNASEGIGAAGARSIRVNRTTRFAYKRAGQVFTLQHPEGDYRQARPWAYVMRGVALQKLSGGELQPFFKTEDIVWGQELIQVAATAIETLDARVARKSEGIIQGKLLEIFHCLPKTGCFAPGYKRND